MNNFHNYDDKTDIKDELFETAEGFIIEQRTTTNSSFKNIGLELPVLLRYNVNNYIGVGVGLQNAILVSEKRQQNIFVEQSANGRINNEIRETLEKTNSFTNIKTSLVLDSTLGFSRIGPSLGARYVMDFDNDFNYLQFYAIWKF